ncbi:MAG: HDIG domain-containing metalloprotein [Candidatus Omnitrophota bacterium]
MNNAPRQLFRRPKPYFFNYFLKLLITFGIWLVLFSMIYVNSQLNLVTGTDAFLYLSGVGFLLAFLIGTGAACLYLFDHKTFADNKDLALILTATALLAVIFEILVMSSLNIYLLPVAGVAMLLALLINPLTSCIVSLILSAAFGLATQESFRVFITMFSGSVLAILLVSNTRRRSQILNTGLLIGVLNCSVISFFGFYDGSNTTGIPPAALWGLGAGIFSSFIVMGLLHLFETLFNITTNITLLELSDLNNPLLKNLILHAPGTYHHSLIVGNLAEAACDAIKANSLLGRVGAYYHDIGKVEKAEYFSENEIEIKSKHTGLTPSMSCLIITNHVRDGVEVARKYRLPRAIVDFIAQHHGTGLIYFFYQRALETVKDEALLKEEDFRYPGPKPQTKEAAVVLLADSVEASSRTLSDPTPAKLRALAQRIINNKFIDGQLDECELSLKDLNKIADSFSRILAGIFHTRIEYPVVSSSST